jgi:GxxExxY protein
LLCFSGGADYATAVAMEKRSGKLLHGELTEQIIGIYHDVHYEFGDGFLEKVCQRAMVIALLEAGLKVTEGMRFDVHFRGHLIGQFFPDIVVNDLVLVEVKCCPRLEPRHKAQAINYLRVSPLEVALLLNFGPQREVERLVYANERKRRWLPPPETAEQSTEQP